MGRKKPTTKAIQVLGAGLLRVPIKMDMRRIRVLFHNDQFQYLKLSVYLVGMKTEGQKTQDKKVERKFMFFIFWFAIDRVQNRFLRYFLLKPTKYLSPQIGGKIGRKSELIFSHKYHCLSYSFFFSSSYLKLPNSHLTTLFHLIKKIFYHLKCEIFSFLIFLTNFVNHIIFYIYK